MRLLQNILFIATGCFLMSAALSSCNDSKSYADLLRDETKAINNYLADQRVIGDAPADSIFITRRGLAEEIYAKSGVTGVDYEEEIGRIMQDLSEDPAKDAPFYRMDEDGNVYMKVVRTGDMETDRNTTTSCISASFAITSPGITPVCIPSPKGMPPMYLTVNRSVTAIISRCHHPHGAKAYSCR